MFSQLLTLFTAPVVYLYLDRLRVWWAERSKSAPPVAHRPSEA
jgi:multidrug efflux pump